MEVGTLVPWAPRGFVFRLQLGEKLRHGLFMVVVGKHFTSLLIVV